MGSSAIIWVMAKRNKKLNNPGQVIIPVDHPNPPEEHEVDTAYILARHYRTTVQFLLPIDSYKHKSPDIVMLGVVWEMKSPKGKSRYTIQEQFKRGSKQARNLVIDTRRTKLDYEFIKKSVLFELTKRPYIKKLILIDKSKKVVEIKM
jgi:hypothetical protein